jgi:hypothetical protein
MGYKPGRVKKRYVDFVERLFDMYEKGMITRIDMTSRLAEWCEKEVALGNKDVQDSENVGR